MESHKEISHKEISCLTDTDGDILSVSCLYKNLNDIFKIHDLFFQNTDFA